VPARGGGSGQETTLICCLLPTSSRNGPRRPGSSSAAAVAYRRSSLTAASSAGNSATISGATVDQLENGRTPNVPRDHPGPRLTKQRAATRADGAHDPGSPAFRVRRLAMRSNSSSILRRDGCRAIGHRDSAPRWVKAVGSRFVRTDRRTHRCRPAISVPRGVIALGPRRPLQSRCVARR